MCGPDVPEDRTAELAREAEAKRTGLIDQGAKSIDESFAGFNDDFFNGARTAQLDAHTAQLADQFKAAQENTIFDLARRGQLESSSGAERLAELNSTHNQALGDISLQADNRANELRSQVEAQKAQLLTQNQSAADPALAKVNAQASAGTFNQPQEPSTLANVFGSFLNSGATVLNSGKFDQQVANIGQRNPNQGGQNIPSSPSKVVS